MFSTWYGLYGNFKDLPRGTAKNKVLRDKLFNIVKNPKYDGHQCGIASKFYKAFDKETSGGAVNNEFMSKQKLGEELHKAITGIFEKRKEHSFLYTIFGVLIYRLHSTYIDFDKKIIRKILNIKLVIM